MEIPAVTIAVTSVIIFLLTHLRHHLQSHRVVMAELLCNWKQGHLWGQTMLVREHLVRSWKVEGWRLHSFAVATCFTAFEVYPYPVWTSLVSVCACCFLSFFHALLWRTLSSWLPPCSYSGATVRSTQNLLFSRLNKDNSLSLSSQGKCFSSWPSWFPTIELAPDLWKQTLSALPTIFWSNYPWFSSD